MKRCIILLLIILSSSVVCHGQLFWKISDNGAQDSYLLGSMHMVSYKYCESLPHFYDIFSSVNVVYGECIMLQDSTTTSSNIAQQNFLSQGKALNNYYTKADFEKILDYCQSAFGVRPVVIKYTPVGLVDAVLRTARNQSSPLSAEGKETVDYALQLLAKSMGKQVKGLEDYEYTNSLSSTGYEGILSGRSIEEQAQSLLDFIQIPENHPDSIKTAYSKIIEMYVAQDLSGLKKALAPLAGTNSGKELLMDRSMSWIPSIIEAINQDHTLFIVGAGHLIGPEGIVEQLKDNGFEVSPVY